MTKISREELYQQVWQTPMIKLAKSYGISDQGLAKLCARHDIPRPPRGYWAKREAGIPVSAAPLPRSKAGEPAIIDIRQATPALKQAMLNKRTVEAARLDIEAAQIPETFRGLHPIVDEWVKEHKRLQAERQRDIRASRRDAWWRPEPILDLTERDRYRFRFTSALLKSLASNGVKTLEGNIRGELLIRVDGNEIKLTVIEKMRQKLGRPNDDQKKWTAFPGHHNAALYSTGYLRVSVNTYFGGGLKNEWVETDKLHGDDLLPHVVSGLLAIGPALTELEREREERWIRAEQERQRREEQRRLAQLDADRWDRFQKLAADWERAAKLRAFHNQLANNVDALAEEIEGMPKAAWLQWSAAKIDDLDPLSRLTCDCEEQEF